MSETIEQAVQRMVGFSKEVRKVLDVIMTGPGKLVYPEAVIPHELMVSGFICRDQNDVWVLSNYGLATITHAKAFGDATARYFAMSGICRRVLQLMKDGAVNPDPNLPAILRNSGFVEKVDGGWVVSDLYKQVQGG